MSALPHSPSLPLSFRRISEADIESIAAIERRVYEFPWTAGNFRDALLSGYRFWGCWAHGHPDSSGQGGDQLVGYAIIMLAIDEAHLLNIAVDARWQRQGIGRRTLQFAMEDARSKECVMLYLEVRPSNQIAQALYEDMGFIKHGIRKAYYPARAGREDALFLGLVL